MKIRLGLIVVLAVIILIPFDTLKFKDNNIVETVDEDITLSTFEEGGMEDDITEINLILDNWETYRKTQYIPVIDESMVINNTSVNITEMEFRSALASLLNTEELHPLFMETLSKLNPYRALIGVYKSNLDVAFGITQINMKLIPLASLYYPDFESNPKSQLRFLNDYIKVKVDKGLGVDGIVKQYKYCLYN